MLTIPEIDTEKYYTAPLVSTLSPRKQAKQATHKRVDVHLLKQLTRFGLVGGLNTLVDILVFNVLLLCWPTTSAMVLLIYNAVAYGIGASNSFVWNKYWTFQRRQAVSHSELGRFSVTTLCGMLVNSMLLWAIGLVLNSFPLNTVLWANASKVLAISATMLLSFLGMRLWVFASKTQHAPHQVSASYNFASNWDHPTGAQEDIPQQGMHSQSSPMREHRSLSVVLPAYNEEAVIASTVLSVVTTLSAWRIDGEILVVNDGSNDHTGAIVAELATQFPQVHLITHTSNQGYGAALVSGFEAATKELTFFMDSDGQFDIRSLELFFPFIEIYDAVLGYRIKRQDTWMRKLNAWGWKVLVYLVLGVQASDIDCAFKLFHTNFLHTHPLETRGAMINAELLYRLKEDNLTRREVGVPHLPRLAGQATGARPAVIIRALHDLAVYTRRWKREARARVQAPQRAQKQSVSSSLSERTFL